METGTNWKAGIAALLWIAVLTGCATTAGIAELSREMTGSRESPVSDSRQEAAWPRQTSGQPTAGPMYQVEAPNWWPSSEWPVQGSLMAMFGLRALESHLGMAGKEQGGGIVELALGPRDFPLGGEVGYSNMGYTREKDESLVQWPWNPNFPGFDSTVSELYFGPRLSFELAEGLRFYTGGGASYMTVSADTGSKQSVESGRDTTWAGYLHSGLIGHVKTFAVGFDLRCNLGGSVELFDQPVDVGYWQIAFGVGIAF